MAFARRGRTPALPSVDDASLVCCVCNNQNVGSTLSIKGQMFGAPCGHYYCTQCKTAQLNAAKSKSGAGRATKVFYCVGTGSDGADCGAALQGSDLTKGQLTEDVEFEEETRIRARVQAAFNRRQEQFPSLEAYNDYLEQAETVVHDLMEAWRKPGKLDKLKAQAEAAIKGENRMNPYKGDNQSRIDAERAMERAAVREAEEERRRSAEQFRLQDAKRREEQKRMKEEIREVALKGTDASSLHKYVRIQHKARRQARAKMANAEGEGFRYGAAAVSGLGAMDQVRLAKVAVVPYPVALRMARPKPAVEVDPTRWNSLILTKTSRKVEKPAQRARRREVAGFLLSDVARRDREEATASLFAVASQA